MTKSKDFVEFNRHRQFGQNQYASDYIEGDGGIPALGCGFRWIMDRSNYHNIKIHKDDELRFDMRWHFYKLLESLGLTDLSKKFVDRIKNHGNLMVTDPSHYDYLEACYGIVCENLSVTDHYNGHFSAHGDKMYQYRDKWVKDGVPWFHATVCYTLALSVYPKEIRDTKNGWVCPSDWVITNYNEGRNLREYMADYTLIHYETLLKWG